MRNRSVALSAIILTLFSVTLSYLKFARCIDTGWISPAVYQLGCYTDITALYDARGFAVDKWPYGSGSNSLEYPLLSGIGIWFIALLTTDGSAGLHQFFYLNIFAISIIYLFLLYLTTRIERKSALVFAISPAVISALFINWDIWAITPMIAAFYLLNKHLYRISGALLAVSIFLKFFPVIFVVPILFFIWRRPLARAPFLQGLFISTLLFNIPFILSDPSGWAKFYIFNYQRGVDFGSLWYLISLKGSWISELNGIATPLVLALLLLVYLRYRNHLLGSIYLASVIFFTLNKVYSPQYVLWLTVISLLFFPKTRIFYLLFAIWQSAEVAYQIGIWRHLLSILQESGGITADTYIVITAIRILTLLLMAGYALYLLENNFVKRGGGESDRQSDLFAHLRWSPRLEIQK